MKIKFPENISFHAPDKVNDPFTSPIAKAQLKSKFKGVIAKDGKWLGPQIGDWQIEHPETGKYIINHRHGARYYSSSFSALGAKASIDILKMDEYKIELNITDSENNPVDIDFAICISFTAYLAG